jgi:hypothetical protein
MLAMLHWYEKMGKHIRVMNSWEYECQSMKSLTPWFLLVVWRKLARAVVSGASLWALPL